MRKWLYLGGAIASEVTATMLLRATVDTPWTSLVVLGYVLAFFLLGLPLRLGMPIGVAYALSFLCLSLSLAAGMHVGVVLIELG